MEVVLVTFPTGKQKKSVESWVIAFWKNAAGTSEKEAEMEE